MMINKTVESLLDSWDLASFELALALLGWVSTLSIKGAIDLHNWANNREKPYSFGYMTDSPYENKRIYYLHKYEIVPRDTDQRNLEKYYYT